MPLNILHEDAMLLVVDKPPGLSVLREGTLQDDTESVADILKAQYPELEQLGEGMRYGIVHRLDKDTSGLLLVAKTKEAYAFFQLQFLERKVQKKYLCLIHGILKEPAGTVTAKLNRSPNDRRKQKVFLPGETGEEKARLAITKYKTIEQFQEYALLEVVPETGRKHQIRAHLAFLHHPIAGDKLYGFKGQTPPPGLTRQFLHASFLKIPLMNGAWQEFHSPLPPDLQTILDTLRI